MNRSITRRIAVITAVLAASACSGSGAEETGDLSGATTLADADASIPGTTPGTIPGTTQGTTPGTSILSSQPVLAPLSAIVDERFSLHAASVTGNGPAGAEAVDLDADGDLDLVMNSFGDRGENPGPVEFPPGAVTILWNEGGLDHWRSEEVFSPDAGIYFPNEAKPVDLDGDGDKDLMIGAGFFVCEFNRDIGPCGALFWLEQTDESWVRHDVVPGGHAGFYHRSEFADLDGDGVDDLVTVAEFAADAQAEWYRGTGDPQQPFETTARVIGQGGGSLPTVHDVDGDGDLDLASGEFFRDSSSYMWFENVAPPGAESPAGTWERHNIDLTTGRTIQLSVIPDLFGDGVDRWVGSNHVNTVTGEPEPLAGIYLLEPGDDLTKPWTPVLLSDGVVSRPTVGTAFQAAPGVFSWGDVDDDGDIDITFSGDGDDRVFWLEQSAPGVFQQHVLIESFGQAAGGIVEDLDGDGDHEVVFTSYETHELLILEYQR